MYVNVVALFGSGLARPNSSTRSRLPCALFPVGGCQDLTDRALDQAGFGPRQYAFTSREPGRASDILRHR